MYCYSGFSSTSLSLLLRKLQQRGDVDDSASAASTCSVAGATRRERRPLSDRLEGKMEENTVRDVDAGV